MKSMLRPVSIVITFVVMMLSLVPISLGLLLVFARTLVSEPAGFLSLKALLFVSISTGLVILMIWGAYGLWKQKKRGYWIGLLYLVVLNVKNIYTLAPTIYKVITTGQLETVSKFHDRSIAILDLGLPTVLSLLLLFLTLRVAFGKPERAYFFPPSN